MNLINRSVNCREITKTTTSSPEGVPGVGVWRLHLRIPDFVRTSGIKFRQTWTTVPSISHRLLQAPTLQLHHLPQCHGSYEWRGGQVWHREIQVSVIVRSMMTLMAIIGFCLQGDCRLKVLSYDLWIRVPTSPTSLFPQQNGASMSRLLPGVHAELWQCPSWRIEGCHQMQQPCHWIRWSWILHI